MGHIVHLGNIGHNSNELVAVFGNWDRWQTIQSNTNNGIPVHIVYLFHLTTSNQQLLNKVMPACFQYNFCLCTSKETFNLRKYNWQRNCNQAAWRQVHSYFIYDERAGKRFFLKNFGPLAVRVPSFPWCHLIRTNLNLLYTCIRKPMLKFRYLSIMGNLVLF